jgi:hypothetical protein
MQKDRKFILKLGLNTYRRQVFVQFGVAFQQHNHSTNMATQRQNIANCERKGKRFENAKQCNDLFDLKAFGQ